MYKLNFRYYQYNSGRADNGTFNASKSFKTLNEAKALKERIEKYLDKSINDKDDYLWMDDFLSNYTWSGFIESVGDIIQVNTSEKKVG
jgi:hypothetical protein